MMEIDIEEFEAEAKAAFHDSYDNELLNHLSASSTMGDNLVETMYQSFVSGYFASMAVHYKVEEK